MDIILVNWNSGELLRNCLKTIANSVNINLTDINVLVVDNNSSDDSLSNLPSTIPNVKVIKNSINLGFGTACNQGIKAGNSEIVLFLNTDVLLLPDTLYKSLNFMKLNHEVLVMGCKHLNKQNEINISCGRKPIFLNGFFELTGLTYLFPKVFPNMLHLNTWDHNTSRYVDHIMGAFYLTRREVLEKVNFFDEHFFVYLEDVDLSIRIANGSTNKIFYNSDIYIYHFGCGSTENVKPFRLYLSLESRLLFAKKHWKKGQYYTYLILLLSIGSIVRIIKPLLRVDIKNTKEVFEAHYLLIKSVLFDIKTRC